MNEQTNERREWKQNENPMSRHFIPASHSDWTFGSMRTIRSQNKRLLSLKLAITFGHHKALALHSIASILECEMKSKWKCSSSSSRSNIQQRSQCVWRQFANSASLCRNENVFSRIFLSCCSLCSVIVVFLLHSETKIQPDFIHIWCAPWIEHTDCKPKNIRFFRLTPFFLLSLSLHCSVGFINKRHSHCWLPFVFVCERVWANLYICNVVMLKMWMLYPSLLTFSCAQSTDKKMLR